jgi:hypothetical protein
MPTVSTSWGRGTGSRGPSSLWRRLRRRTLAPGRPALYPDQLGLALFSLLAIASGIYVVVRFLL